MKGRQAIPRFAPAPVAADDPQEQNADDLEREGESESERASERERKVN